MIAPNANRTHKIIRNIICGNILSLQIVVVPNSLAEVPPVEGLLAFIMSNNRLYLRTKWAWRSIAEQRQVNYHGTNKEFGNRHATSTATIEKTTYLYL